MSTTKSTKREIAFWYDEDGGEIHLSQGRFVVTVAPDHTTSDRGHRKLFEWLRSQLVADGKPAPAERNFDPKSVNKDLRKPSRRK
jgi:hypothetical protein